MKYRIVCVVNDISQPGARLQSEHGLSFWIQTPRGSVLLDTGSTTLVLKHNLAELGLDPRHLDALVLSHAHYDHTGGLPAVLEINPEIPIHAHPDILQARYSYKNGEYHSIGIPQESFLLIKQAALKLDAAPIEVLPKLFTTGEISQRSELEGRSATHFIRPKQSWQPDPYRDDLSMVLVTQRGLVVICGCCHAGLLNTLAHVRRTFPLPIHMLIGGTHLISMDGASLKHVVDVLKKEYPHIEYYPNHCTGEQAFQALTQEFGTKVHACPAGTIIEIED